jgi:ADP-ribosylglycohydrolase
MLNIQGRCNGAFIGHAIASNYDPSISMAINITDSLLEKKKFDGPDILSRHLFLYHKQPCEIGETTKYLYQIAADNVQNAGDKSSLSRQDFLLNQSFIDESVRLTDNKLGGYTAGCGPAQRSFPLALCSWIDDDDLFEMSVKEATLTHFNPLAGQVAGVINVICRSLLKNHSWHNAVQAGFSIPRLHSDVTSVYTRYGRSPHPLIRTHIAYAPTVLNAALHYVHNSTKAMEAIQTARSN